jgi:hypothetical protein
MNSRSLVVSIMDTIVVILAAAVLRLQYRHLQRSGTGTHDALFESEV